MPEPEKQVAARERSFSGSYRSTLTCSGNWRQRGDKMSSVIGRDTPCVRNGEVWPACRGTDSLQNFFAEVPYFRHDNQFLAGDPFFYG
jgi:hypothetical protein